VARAPVVSATAPERAQPASRGLDGAGRAPRNVIVSHHPITMGSCFSASYDVAAVLVRRSQPAPGWTACTVRMIFDFEHACAVKLAYSGTVWLGG
jgi:hypothetical protein